MAKITKPIVEVYIHMRYIQICVADGYMSAGERVRWRHERQLTMQVMQSYYKVTDNSPCSPSHPNAFSAHEFSSNKTVCDKAD